MFHAIFTRNSVRNSDSRSGSGAGLGVASSKSLPIPQSRVGRDHYNSSDAQNFSLPILTPDSESHPRNGSRSRSGVRISGSGVRTGIYSRSMSMSCLTSCKSHSRFSLPIPIPIFLLKVTPDFVRKSGVTQKLNFAH